MSANTLSSIPTHYIFLGTGVLTFFTFELPAYVHLTLAVAFIGALTIISSRSSDDEEEEAPEQEQTIESKEAIQEPLRKRHQESTRAVEMTVDVPPPTPMTSSSSSCSSSTPSTSTFSFSSLPSTPRTPSTPGSPRRAAFVRQLQRRAQLLVGLTMRSHKAQISIGSKSVLVGMKASGCAGRAKRVAVPRRRAGKRV